MDGSRDGITPHLTKPLLSIRLSRSVPRLFLPCTRNKALLKTPRITQTLRTNKASHTTPFLGSSCTPTLRVAVILATTSVLSASSLLHLLPSVIPCSRMLRNIFVGPAGGVSSIVDLLRIPRCLPPPRSLYLAPLICPIFPLPDKPGQLIGFVDAAHANDLRRHRSTTGYAFLLNFGVISYRSKTQSTTATLSTEAEFLAAVTAAKHASRVQPNIYWQQARTN